MPSKKETITDSIELLLDKSTECFEFAQTQQQIADLQRANAEKMSGIGEALVEHAADLQGQIEMATGRTTPPMREVRGAFRERARRRKLG
jgi:hypothetical protein